MFNLGLGEIILIAIIALLVFGPERLPELARQVARLYAQLRGAADEVQRAVMAEAQPLRQPFDEARRDIEAVTRPMKETAQELRSPLSALPAPADAPAAPAPNGARAYKPVSRVPEEEDDGGNLA